jgi:hypothetical protein
LHTEHQYREETEQGTRRGGEGERERERETETNRQRQTEDRQTEGDKIRHTVSLIEAAHLSTG